MTNIREALAEFNPWWNGGFSVPFKSREVYRQLQKYLAMPHIIALTGLRRVGKTTLMMKLAEDAIKGGLNPKDVIYFSFDEFRDSDIRSLLNEHESMTGRSARRGRRMLLLDEVQKLRGWEDQLKAIYDLHGKSMKIVISGSESLFIRKGIRETLAGRMFEFRVEPLSFAEFLDFRGIAYKPVGIHERELAGALEEFAASMGLPELVGVKDSDVISKYVKESIVEKVLYRDMPELLGLRSVSAMESLLNILLEEPGQIVEISGMAKELGISRQTLSSYLSYLEGSFLVRKLYNFSNNRRKTERKLKKYYPAIISPMLLFRDDNLSRSRVFEWLVANQLKAEFFWRDQYKNEVDIILPGKKLTPIEVKYGMIDFGGMAAFMKKFGVREGFIVSRDKEMEHKFGRNIIHVVPAFKFLLERA